MRSHEESLSSEQCRRILAALESGAKTYSELVKPTRLTLGSIKKHVAVLVVADLAEVGPEELVAKR
jgi:predicted transcriptional regulator